MHVEFDNLDYRHGSAVNRTWNLSISDFMPWPPLSLNPHYFYVTNLLIIIIKLNNLESKKIIITYDYAASYSKCSRYLTQVAYSSHLNAVLTIDITTQFCDRRWMWPLFFYIVAYYLLILIRYYIILYKISKSQRQHVGYAYTVFSYYKLLF